MERLLIRLAGLTLLLSLLLSVPVSAEQPKFGGTLTVIDLADPVNLNPMLVGDGYSTRLVNNIYDSLVKYDKDLKLVGNLAESWKVSEDGLTYTFKLKAGVKWHDGKEFTSKDVKYTFDTIRKEKLIAAPILAPIRDIATPDKLTVTITLKEQIGGFLDGLVGLYWGTLIVAEHIYNGTDIKTNPYNLKPVGTGPFRFVEWKKGSHIMLEANWEYNRGGPYVDKLIYRIIPEHAAAVMALEAGEAQYIYLWTPKSELARLRKVKGLSVYTGSGPGGSIMVVGINTQHPSSPIKDVRVRQAMFLAIDRQEIVDNILYGAAEIGTSSIASSVKPYYHPKIRDMYPFKPDFERANKLLDEAGYKRGPDGMRFSVEVMNRRGDTEREDATMFMKQTWAKIGIDLKIRPTEVATLNEKIGWGKAMIKRDYELVTWSLTTGPEPDVGIYSRYHTTGTRNFVSYSNPRVDELLELGKREANYEKRRQYYYEIQEIMMKDLPQLPIWEDHDTHVYSTDFAGIPVLPFGYMSQFNTVWWIKGTDVSPREAKATIVNAEKEIAELKNKGYEVSDALKRLEEARKALDAGKYVEAYKLATEAVTLAKAPPPILEYALGAVAVIGIVTVAIFFYRKRTRPKPA